MDHRGVNSWIRRTVTCAIIVCGVGASACTEAFAPEYALVAPRIVAVELSRSEVIEGEGVTATVVAAGPDGRLDVGDAQWWTCPDARGTFLDPSPICDGNRLSRGEGETITFTSRTELFGDDFGGRDEAGPWSSTERFFGAALAHRAVIGVTVQTDDGARDAFTRLSVFPSVDVASVAPALEPALVHLASNGELRSNTATVVTGVDVVDDIEGATVDTVRRGQTVFLVPHYDDVTLSTYAVVDAKLTDVDMGDDRSLLDLEDSDIESRFTQIERCEVPTFQWLVSAGVVRRPFTRDVDVLPRVYAARGENCEYPGPDEKPAVRFTWGEEAEAPKGGVVIGELVVRDGRGLDRAFSFSFAVED